MFQAYSCLTAFTFAVPSRRYALPNGHHIALARVTSSSHYPVSFSSEQLLLCVITLIIYLFTCSISFSLP